MKKKLLVCSIVFFSLTSIPLSGYCQVDRDKLAKIIMEKYEEQLAKERARQLEELRRQQLLAQQRRQEQMTDEIINNPTRIIADLNDPEKREIILNNPELKEILRDQLKNNDRILSIMDNDREIRSMIMSDRELQKQVVDKIWDNKDRVLDYARDPDKRRIIMKEPLLREYYELKQKEQDLSLHPEKAYEYMRDPQMRDYIMKNKELKDALVDRIREEQNIEKKKLEEAAEERRIQREIEKAEELRVKEEQGRAAQQITEMKEEKEKSNMEAEELLSMATSRNISMPNIEKYVQEANDILESFSIRPISIPQSNGGYNNPKAAEENAGSRKTRTKVIDRGKVGVIQTLPQMNIDMDKVSQKMAQSGALDVPADMVKNAMGYSRSVIPGPQIIIPSPSTGSSIYDIKIEEEDFITKVFSRKTARRMVDLAINYTPEKYEEFKNDIVTPFKEDVTNTLGGLFYVPQKAVKSLKNIFFNENEKPENEKE